MINETRQYIFNLEVKRRLAPDGNDPRTKAAEQLKRNQGMFEYFFGGSLNGEKWTYVKAVAYSKEPPVLDCTNDGSCQCKDFVVHISKIPQLMELINSKCPITKNEEKDPNDLICMVQNLLFCLPNSEVMVKSNHVDAISAAGNEVGSVENIKVWFPTPVQQAIQCKKCLGNVCNIYRNDLSLFIHLLILQFLLVHGGLAKQH